MRTANLGVWSSGYMSIFGLKNVHIFEIERSALYVLSTLSNFSCLNTTLRLIINRNSERVKLYP